MVDKQMIKVLGCDVKLRDKPLENRRFNFFRYMIWLWRIFFNLFNAGLKAEDSIIHFISLVFIVKELFLVLSLFIDDKVNFRAQRDRDIFAIHNWLIGFWVPFIGIIFIAIRYDDIGASNLFKRVFLIYQFVQGGKNRNFSSFDFYFLTSLHQKMIERCIFLINMQWKQDVSGLSESDNWLYIQTQYLWYILEVLVFNELSLKFLRS